MTLYHFTSYYHLAMIRQAGYLRLTESNIGSPDPNIKPFGENVGPRVVWLTENPDAQLDNGLVGCTIDKRAVRFTIEIDEKEVMRWRDFANLHGIHHKWYRALDISGGYTAKYWWVSTKEIPVTANTVIKSL
jgi:hypothetical protein